MPADDSARWADDHRAKKIRWHGAWGGDDMVRYGRSKRNLFSLAAMGRTVAGFLTGLALVLDVAPPAAAGDQTQGWFDPSLFTLRQSVSTLAATTTNASGASAAGRAIVSETELDYRVTDWYQLALVAS